MTFLLLLLCLFMLAWLMRGQILRWLLHKSLNQYARRAESQFAAGQAPRERKGGWSNPLKRRKKIDPAVGEYVRFTETSATATGTTDQQTERTDVHTETQITDVEWEDIS